MRSLGASCGGTSPPYSKTLCCSAEEDRSQLRHSFTQFVTRLRVHSCAKLVYMFYDRGLDAVKQSFCERCRFPLTDGHFVGLNQDEPELIGPRRLRNLRGKEEKLTVEETARDGCMKTSRTCQAMSTASTLRSTTLPDDHFKNTSFQRTEKSKPSRR